MCVNIKELLHAFTSLPTVPDIPKKQASIALYQSLQSKCDPSLQLISKSQANGTGKPIQDGAAAVRHWLALRATRDERDQRDTQHGFQAVLLHPKESIHGFIKRFYHAAHALKLSGVELTEIELVVPYLFALKSPHQSSSNTSVVMRYFNHQDKWSLECAADKEAPTYNNNMRSSFPTAATGLQPTNGREDAIDPQGRPRAYYHQRLLFTRPSLPPLHSHAQHPLFSTEAATWSFDNQPSPQRSDDHNDSFSHKPKVSPLRLPEGIASPDLNVLIQQRP